MRHSFLPGSYWLKKKINKTSHYFEKTRDESLCSQPGLLLNKKPGSKHEQGRKEAVPCHRIMFVASEKSLFSFQWALCLHMKVDMGT